MTTMSPHSPSSAPTQRLVFGMGLAIVAIELVSLVYLYRASTDFIVARREQRLHLYSPGVVVTWQGQSLGQLYGWSRPDQMGALSVGPAAAFAVRIPDTSIASDGIVRVEFRVDEHRSPRVLGVSPDTRAIGFRLIEWQISGLDVKTS